MIYRAFQGEKLSALGFGTMRLPVKDGNDAAVDEARAGEMVDYAIAHGVNYFDTAWGYHGGQSELVIGRLLKKYPRERFYLASKFPGYDLSNMGKTAEIFERQLEKCQVDYFDFYLFHNVCESNIDAYLDERYKTFEVLSAEKARGRIRHLGFSAHGELPVIRRFLEKYGHSMEFCQLQINWLDWKFQRADEKVALLRDYGIPIWVMEPVRGGKLAALPDADMKILQSFRPEETAAGWAFRFIQSLPEVVVTLSGMSDFEQVKQNIDTFSTDAPVSKEEAAALETIARRMISGHALPCTACRYCLSHCPRHLDIPEMIRLYNEHRFTGGGFIAPMLLSSLPKEKWPSACIGCRSCEKVCPQQIKISEMMKDFTKRLKG